MGSAYHGAKTLMHGLVAYGQAVCRHKLGHLFVAAVPVLHYPVKQSLKCGAFGINIITQNVDSPAVLGAYFYCRDIF